MKVKVGSYTGNGTSGTTTNPITGVGFPPRFVMVRRYNSSEIPLSRSESMPANNSKPMTSASAIQTTTGIVTLDSDGFTLKGQDGNSNVNGATYFYLAVGGEGSDFAYGSYTGNASDNRNVSIGGSFTGTPDMVIVMSEAADRVCFRTSDMSGDSSAGMNQTLQTNAIQAFGSGTFQVGTDGQVNTNTTVYHWVAFKNVTDVFKVFTYVGDASDDRNITGLGIDPPTYAFVYRSSTSNQTVRGSTLFSGDSSSRFDNTAGIAANFIQALISDGIQVGSNAVVNANGVTFYGFAFKDAVGVPMGAISSYHTLVGGTR